MLKITQIRCLQQFQLWFYGSKNGEVELLKLGKGKRVWKHLRIISLVFHFSSTQAVSGLQAVLGGKVTVSSDPLWPMDSVMLTEGPDTHQEQHLSMPPACKWYSLLVSLSLAAPNLGIAIFSLPAHHLPHPQTTASVSPHTFSIQAIHSQFKHSQRYCLNFWWSCVEPGVTLSDPCQSLPKEGWNGAEQNCL